jgi:hypothetical protein
MSLLAGSDQLSRNKIQQWEYEMLYLRHCPLLIPVFHFCWAQHFIPAFHFCRAQHLHNSGPSSLKECRNCDVGSGKGKEMYLLFRMKEMTNFAFALFAKSTCCFPLVFVNYYQMAFSICQLLPNRDIHSLRADSVLAGFSPQRRLLSNIFRVDSWVHHIVACWLVL